MVERWLPAALSQHLILSAYPWGTPPKVLELIDAQWPALAQVLIPKSISRARGMDNTDSQSHMSTLIAGGGGGEPIQTSWHVYEIRVVPQRKV